MSLRSLTVGLLVLLFIVGAASIAGYAAFAWDASLPTNLCVTGDPTNSPCTTTSTKWPGYCTSASPCTFAYGTTIYDSVTIYDPLESGGVYNGCSSTGFGSGYHACAITGTVNFSVYSVPSNYVCTSKGTLTAINDRQLKPSGTGVILVGSVQSFHFPSSSPYDYPPVIVTSPNGYNLPAGSYVAYVHYKGNYKDNTDNSGYFAGQCEYFTVTPPTSGVPEFPVGLFAVIAAGLPMLALMRVKFARSL